MATDNNSELIENIDKKAEEFATWFRQEFKAFYQSLKTRSGNLNNEFGVEYEEDYHFINDFLGILER